MRLKSKGIRLVGGLCGTVPGSDQTVPRAELYAPRATLPMIMKPARIFLDHENHVKAIKKGKAWCTSPMRPHVDLWEQIWWNIEEQGGLVRDLRILYTPAHTKERPGESAEEKHRRVGKRMGRCVRQKRARSAGGQQGSGRRGHGRHVQRR